MVILYLCVVSTTITIAQNNEWKQYKNVESAGFSKITLEDIQQQLDTTSTAGFGGHRILIIPEDDLVIVYRVNTYKRLSASESSIEKIVIGILNAKSTASDNDSELKLIPYTPL
ncbi:MAG: hypothetical protein ABJN84_15250 [Flavobacteriaceae bacterium]